MAVQIAESATSAKQAKTKKTVDHLELHPKMGGGHIVKHVYTSYEHEPKEVHFNEDGKSQGGEHIMSHLKKHAGLPLMSGAEGNGDETEHQEQD